MLTIERLVFNGHRFTDVLGYTLPQAHTLQAAIRYRERFEDITAMGLTRAGVMLAEGSAKDFLKVVKEMENDD